MEIRALEREDIAETVELWYETSLETHEFIKSEYWMENKKNMAEIYLPNSESFLATEEGRIVGFISMTENFLAAIFVRINMQSRGIGKKLLNSVKKENESIMLKVYKKNHRAVQFYKNQGFSILSEEIDKNTSEAEYLMEWKK